MAFNEKTNRRNDEAERCRKIRTKSGDIIENKRQKGGINLQEYKGENLRLEVCSMACLFTKYDEK